MTLALDILMDRLSDTRDRLDMMLEVTGAARTFCTTAAKNGAAVDLHVTGGGLDARISLLVDLSDVGRDRAEAVSPLPAADDPAEAGDDLADDDGAPWQVVEDVRFWSPRAAEPEDEQAAGPEPDQSRTGAEPEHGSDAPVPHDRTGTPWSPHEDDLLLTEKGRGLAMSAVARMLGRPQSACWARWKKITRRAADPSPAEPVSDPSATEPDPAPPSAAAATPAPVATSAVETDPVPPPAALAGADARVSWRLDQLGYRRGWSADRDLDLAEGLSQGRKIAEIALDIGLDAAECKRRWFDLCPSGGLDEQRQVLRVLRHRAAAAQTQAA